jgi:hypothetical protein
MNKDKIRIVIKALKETPHADRFSMESWGHPCGTPACAIGNYAARTDLQDELKLIPNERGWQQLTSARNGMAVALDDVSEMFDLSEVEADILFGPNGCGGANTTEQAVAFLEWYLTKPDFAQITFECERDHSEY